MKREWKKPQLIVVIRGSPEENVLTGCKGGVYVGGSSGSHGICSELYDIAKCNGCDSVTIT